MSATICVRQVKPIPVGSLRVSHAGDQSRKSGNENLQQLTQEISSLARNSGELESQYNAIVEHYESLAKEASI